MNWAHCLWAQFNSLTQHCLLLFVNETSTFQWQSVEQTSSTATSVSGRRTFVNEWYQLSCAFEPDLEESADKSRSLSPHTQTAFSDYVAWACVNWEWFSEICDPWNIFLFLLGRICMWHFSILHECDWSVIYEGQTPIGVPSLKEGFSYFNVKYICTVSWHVTRFCSKI